MANTNILLPFLSPLAKNIPFVDPTTGNLSPDALRWVVELERTVFGVWADVPYDAANFLTNNPAITWNVAAGNQAQLATFQMGTFATAHFYITGGTVSVNVATLEITLPRINVPSPPQGFPSLCRIVDGAAAPEVGYCVMSGSATNMAVITIAKLSGANFLAASAAIEVEGFTCFKCNSFVTP